MGFGPFVTQKRKKKRKKKEITVVYCLCLEFSSFHSATLSKMTLYFLLLSAGSFFSFLRFVSVYHPQMHEFMLLTQGDSLHICPSSSHTYKCAVVVHCHNTGNCLQFGKSFMQLPSQKYLSKNFVFHLLLFISFGLLLFFFFFGLCLWGG